MNFQRETTSAQRKADWWSNFKAFALIGIVILAMFLYLGYQIINQLQMGPTQKDFMYLAVILLAGLILYGIHVLSSPD